MLGNNLFEVIPTFLFLLLIFLTLTGLIEARVRVSDLAKGVLLALLTASVLVEEVSPAVVLGEDLVVSLHAVHKLDDRLCREVLNAIFRSLRARVYPLDLTCYLRVTDVYKLTPIK